MNEDQQGQIERLRVERSDTNRFASNIEFYQWADEVAGILACDPQAFRRFKYYVEAVQSAYAFDTNPLDSINKAIGCFNEYLFVLQYQNSITKQERDPVDTAAGNQMRQEHASNCGQVSAPPIGASENPRQTQKRLLLEKAQRAVLYLVGAIATAVVGAVVGKLL